MSAHNFRVTPEPEVWPDQTEHQDPTVKQELQDHQETPDQEDHQVLQVAEVPVVPEDLKEDVVHPVRMELQGVLEDRDYQEGQAVLDNQERVAFRSVCHGNIAIL